MEGWPCGGVAANEFVGVRAKNKKVPHQYLSYLYYSLVCLTPCHLFGVTRVLQTPKKMSVWSALVTQKYEGPESSGHSDFG